MSKPKTLFGLEVERGGWYGERMKWYTQKQLDDLRKKLVERASETALREPPHPDDKGYQHIYAQCGGCMHFAAYDSDYGICLEEQSPNFGRVVQEHSGCKLHSWWKDHDY